MSVYAPTTDYIWELLRARGLDPAPVFREAGLDPDTRRNVRHRVPRDRFDRLVELAASACRDEAFGLRATSRFHPSHFGPLGYSWLSSSTLRSAIGKFMRYSRLVDDISNMSLQESGAHAVFDMTWPRGTRAACLTQTALALFVHLCRLIVGSDFNPERVEFCQAAPRDAGPFKAHFRAPLSFAAGADRIFLPLATLDEPLPRAHPELARLHNEVIDRYLAQRDRTDIVSLCKAAIFELLSTGNASAESVAERMNLTPKTLSRRLARRGVTFRELLSEQRRELAIRYLQDESLSLTEISYLLGFSEPSSFSRAYKVWTGISPTMARTAGNA